MKKARGPNDPRALNDGAQGETRTRTDYSTRPSNVRGYQLRHLSKFSKNNKYEDLITLLPEQRQLERRPVQKPVKRLELRSELRHL